MILARYIVRTLLAHMLTVLGALLALITVFNFLEQLDDVGVGDYTLPAGGLHALMLVPSWLMNFAPVAAFLGALTGLGRLHQDSELTAIRAAGWSVGRVALTAACAGMLLALASTLAGEFVAPRLAQAADRMKAELRFGRQLSAGNSGWWTADGSRLVGIDRRPGNPVVTVIELGADGEVVALGEAQDIRQDADGTVSYFGYQETRYSRDGTRIRDFAVLPEKSLAVASLLRLSQGTARFASLRQLVARRRQLERAALDTRETSYEMNERLARMVTSPLLVLLAVPAVLGVLRSSRQAARLVLGLAVGFVLAMAQDIAHSMVVVFRGPPELLAWTPAALTLIAAVMLARRLRPRSAPTD
ncbi:MAG TPA: LptF/LptG family permease [Steroidobacteraceae bacterium]|nr:LptF/LptG family permease [Steroidobacteraceae bacterium]